MMTTEDKPKTLIRSAREDDYQTIFALTELRFGKNYLRYEDFLHWLEFPDLFLVIEENGEFAGYVSLLIDAAEATAAHVQIPVAEVLAASHGQLKVIRCRSAALMEKFEGKGYMRQLWLEVMKNAAATGLKVAYCPAWKYNDFIPMDHLLTSLGYKFLCEKKMLWYNDKNHICRICNGPCKCTAVIYRYDF